MKKIILIAISFFVNTTAFTQNLSIPFPENMEVDGIPAIPISISNEVKNYTEFRGASFSSWHPQKKEMLIITRFANSNQVHYVKQPLGDRKQMTFFDEPVSSAEFEPTNGDYFLFGKDNGGNEFAQIFKFDFPTKKVDLISDGKRSQNGGISWNPAKTKIAYTSTKRNGSDRDIYIMNPKDTSTNTLVVSNNGGGWGIVDWAPDEKTILIQEGLSINESRLYTYDFNSKTKTRLIPEKDERATYNGLFYSNDGKGIYLLTNKESEFNRFAYLSLPDKKLSYLSNEINWDIQEANLSENGASIVLKANENGISKLYLYSIAEKKLQALPNIPVGIISGITWYKDSQSFAFTFNAFNSSSDVYEYNIVNNQLIRWTESETGGININTLSSPELIKWKSFDGKEISGFLYKASSKFAGKRPVIISIHGGPEGQSLPVFVGRNNYILNELGINIIYPNVRGSDGFGKSFLDADNGFKREESVKDIGALLEWIANQENLDKDRIMIMGGSYGGYMTLASSFMYASKIRCSIDIVGISNFNTFMKNTEAYRRDLRRVEYGDERNPEMSAFFEKISPSNHALEIKKPLFIVQGFNDPRVPYTEAVQMKNKIKESGGTVWFLMAKDEGHGFKKKNNIDFQFYSTIEFIKKYLLN